MSRELRTYYEVPLDVCVHIGDRNDEESVRQEFLKHVRSLGTNEREPFNLTGVRCRGCAVWARDFPLFSLVEACFRKACILNLPIPAALKDVKERYSRKSLFKEEDGYFVSVDAGDAHLRKDSDGRYELASYRCAERDREQFFLDFFHALPRKIIWVIVAPTEVAIDVHRLGFEYEYDRPEESSFDLSCALYCRELYPDPLCAIKRDGSNKRKSLCSAF